jgi:hypothetical protein
MYMYLCCVPQRDTRLLGKAYHAASLLGHALKRTGVNCSISKLTWTKTELECLQDQDRVIVDP